MPRWRRGLFRTLVSFAFQSLPCQPTQMVGRHNLEPFSTFTHVEELVSRKLVLPVSTPRLIAGGTPDAGQVLAQYHSLKPSFRLPRCVAPLVLLNLLARPYPAGLLLPAPERRPAVVPRAMMGPTERYRRAVMGPLSEPGLPSMMSVAATATPVIFLRATASLLPDPKNIGPVFSGDARL